LLRSSAEKSGGYEMDEREMRLAGCFSAVFPGLTVREIAKADSMSVPAWDSVAGVALLAEVEEEFGISIDAEDLSRFNSFAGFLSYLQESEDRRQVYGTSSTL
jgi:acyl carrier protein